MKTPKEQKGPAKGLFGRAGLPLARAYVQPPRRKWLLGTALLAALAAAALLAGDVWLERGLFISNGPLASAHAAFEGDCASCHTAFASAGDDKCSVCHESYGEEPGLHSFDAHYIYRSGDFTRAYRREGETPCRDCHSEHRGREALIISQSDAKCVSCHEFGDFGQAHPEFDFMAEQTADSANLTFTHIRHVQNVRREKTVDDIEEACLFCHQPRRDGRGFGPISFEDHCQDCHLGASQRVRSQPMEVRDASQPLLRAAQGRAVLNLGVDTLQMVRSSQGPGEQWALQTSPAEFRQRAGTVMSMRLYHKDPWITHNLRKLRQVVYPSAGLADLLQASADVPDHQAEQLYQEVVHTLRQYLNGLRGRSQDRGMLSEVTSLDEVLSDVERQIKEGGASLEDAPFLLPDRVNPLLDPGQVEAIGQFADRLTAACQKCHRLDRLTIARVQKDQRVLRRAEFNHRAHVLQKRCLDCHSAIPFFDYIGPLAAPADSPEIEEQVDNASIQNLPAVDTCRQCHVSGLVTDRCVSCHRFHADERIDSRMLLHPRQSIPVQPAEESR